MEPKNLLEPSQAEQQDLDPELKVLVVEDNRWNQNLAVAMLKGFGLSPDVAGNGAEALENIKKFHYDIVLMDMQMPVMDGLEATQKIRELYSHKNIYIAGLTANVSEEDKELCLKAGMDLYLTKPIQKGLLFCTLKDVQTNRDRMHADGQQSVVNLIHFEALKEFRALVSQEPEIYVPFIEGFLGSHEELLGKILQALRGGSYVLAKELVHELKGLVAVMCAKNIASDLAEIEAQIVEGTGKGLVENFQKVAKDIRSLSRSLEDLQSKFAA